MAITATTTFKQDVIKTTTSGPLSSAHTHAVSATETRADGTAANQANEVWSKTAALAAATQTFDLQALTDEAGAALSFQTIYSIYVENLSTTASESVTVGNAAANIWEPFVGTTGDRIVVDPSSSTNKSVWFQSSAGGWTVDATNKDLMLDPGANTFNVKIQVVGKKS